MKFKVTLLSGACLAMCASVYAQTSIQDAAGNASPRQSGYMSFPSDEMDFVREQDVEVAFKDVNNAHIQCNLEGKNKVAELDRLAKSFYLANQDDRRVDLPDKYNTVTPDKAWIIRHTCGWSAPEMLWVISVDNESITKMYDEIQRSTREEQAREQVIRAQESSDERQQDHRLGAIKRQSDAASLEMINNLGNALGNPGETPQEAAESQSNGTRCDLAGKAKVAYWDHVAKHTYYNNQDPHAGDFVQGEAFIVRTKCKWRAPDAPWIIPTN